MYPAIFSRGFFKIEFPRDLYRFSFYIHRSTRIDVCSFNSRKTVNDTHRLHVVYPKRIYISEPDAHNLYYIRPNRDCFPAARLCLITDVSRCLIRMLSMSIYVVCLLVSPAWGTTITDRDEHAGGVKHTTSSYSPNMIVRVRYVSVTESSLVFDDRCDCTCQALVKVHHATAITSWNRSIPLAQSVSVPAVWKYNRKLSITHRHSKNIRKLKGYKSSNDQTTSYVSWFIIETIEHVSIYILALAILISGDSDLNLVTRI